MARYKPGFWVAKSRYPSQAASSRARAAEASVADAGAGSIAVAMESASMPAACCAIASSSALRSRKCRYAAAGETPARRCTSRSDSESGPSAATIAIASCTSRSARGFRASAELGVDTANSFC